MHWFPGRVFVFASRSEQDSFPGGARYMETKQPSIILLGPPASGKGTQARALSMLPGFAHLSTGQVLREKSRGNDARAQEIREALDEGRLLSDERIFTVFHECLREQREAGCLRADDILVLNGIPRTVNQARKLEETITISRVLVMGYADEKALRQRIKGRAQEEQRSDDMREEVIATRLEVYHEETEPLIEYYRTRAPDAIAEVNCLQSPPEVLRDVLQVVRPVYERLRGTEIHGKRERR